MVKVERVAVEASGDYRMIRVAVNGVLLAPLWMSAPEFWSYEQMGEDRMWQKIGMHAIMADQAGRVVGPAHRAGGSRVGGVEGTREGPR